MSLGIVTKQDIKEVQKVMHNIVITGKWLSDMSIENQKLFMKIISTLDDTADYQAVLALTVSTYHCIKLSMERIGKKIPVVTDKTMKEVGIGAKRIFDEKGHEKYLEYRMEIIIKNNRILYEFLEDKFEILESKHRKRTARNACSIIFLMYSSLDAQALKNEIIAH